MPPARTVLEVSRPDPPPPHPGNIGLVPAPGETPRPFPPFPPALAAGALKSSIEEERALPPADDVAAVPPTPAPPPGTVHGPTTRLEAVDPVAPDVSSVVLAAPPEGAAGIV